MLIAINGNGIQSRERSTWPKKDGKDFMKVMEGDRALDELGERSIYN